MGNSRIRPSPACWEGLRALAVHARASARIVTASLAVRLIFCCGLPTLKPKAAQRYRPRDHVECARRSDARGEPGLIKSLCVVENEGTTPAPIRRTGARASGSR